MRHIPAMTPFARTMLVLPFCALVAGCITTSPEQQAKRNEERCVARGYKPGTDEFSDCVVRIDNERDQRMERNRRETMERPPPPSPTRGY